MKLCKDCIHFRNPHPINPAPAKCYHPESFIQQELIYGKKEYRTCETMRHSVTSCGLEGKYHATV
jgi:hypothetical protein